MKITEIEKQSVKSKKSREKNELQSSAWKIVTKIGIAEKPCLPVKRLIEI